MKRRGGRGGGEEEGGEGREGKKEKGETGERHKVEKEISECAYLCKYLLFTKNSISSQTQDR